MDLSELKPERNPSVHRPPPPEVDADVSRDPAKVLSAVAYSSALVSNSLSALPLPTTISQPKWCLRQERICGPKSKEPATAETHTASQPTVTDVKTATLKPTARALFSDRIREEALRNRTIFIPSL